PRGARGGAGRRRRPDRGQGPRGLPDRGHREAAFRRPRSCGGDIGMAGISVVSPGAGSRAARTLGGVTELLGATLVAFEARPSDVARRQVEGASIDTRTLRPGEMFVALEGERVDGHAFVAAALEKGAAAAIV